MTERRDRHVSENGGDPGVFCGGRFERFLAGAPQLPAGVFDKPREPSYTT